jgi:4a-hydroxytetrahydrobiopterin dehydratase
MATSIARSEFNATYDLPDWRVVLRAIEAWFDAPSFSEAAAFVAEVAAAADDAGHHPDVDLRYPGRVLVRLTSHDANGLTDRDARLAATISALAGDRGLAATPREGQRVEVAIDVLDLEAVRPFWKAVLAYEDGTPWEEGDPIHDLYDPRGIGPAFWFQQMDEPRPQRNRIHLDVIVPHDEVDDRIAAALAAGGTLLTDRWARAFWVLADPEGNEACLCTWQDRD